MEKITDKSYPRKAKPRNNGKGKNDPQPIPPFSTMPEPEKEPEVSTAPTEVSAAPTEVSAAPTEVSAAPTEVSTAPDNTTPDNVLPMAPKPKKYSVGSRIGITTDDAATVQHQHGLMQNAQRSLGAEVQRHEGQKRVLFQALANVESNQRVIIQAIGRKMGLGIDDAKQNWSFDFDNNQFELKA